MYFNPSKGIKGYSRDDYRSLLSFYTLDKVRPVSNGEDYLILCQRAIVASQRHKGIEFNETGDFPQFSQPLNEFSHYIPGWEYSPEELDVFYKHYNTRNLDEAHMMFEKYYPLDPSFSKLVNWLKTKAPKKVINYLCFMFGRQDKADLFDNNYISRYNLDSDININVLISSPDMFLSNNEEEIAIKLNKPMKSLAIPPKAILSTAFQRNKGDSSSLVIKENKKIDVIENVDRNNEEIFRLGKFIEHPVIKQYVSELKSKKVPEDNTLISYIIKNTAAESNERYELLNFIPIGKLQRYVDSYNISILDPASDINRKQNILNALMFLKGDVELQAKEPFIPLEYDRLDSNSDNPYTLKELLPFADMYGIETEGLSRNDIINNIYLLQFIPSFFVPTNYDCLPNKNDAIYLYGLRYKNYTVCLSRSELYKSFKANNDFKHDDIIFNYHAVNKLFYILTFDESNESKMLRDLISNIFKSTLNTYDNDIEFLSSIPEEPITIGDLSTTYRQNVYEIIKYIAYVGEIMKTRPRKLKVVLDEFMRMVERTPTIITDVLMRLPCVGSEMTIGELYDYIVEGKGLKGLDSVLINTSEKYSKVLQ